MNTHDKKSTGLDREETDPSTARPDEKRAWQEPKLTFVEPTLTKHGDVTKLTAANGFIGTFIPE